MAIPVHLAVHVLGLAVAAGLGSLVLVVRRTPGADPAGRTPGADPAGRTPAADPAGRDDPGRLGIAVGAALLVVSHVLVGGRFIEPDGLAALVRAAGYAGIAVGAAGRLVGYAAVLAVVPPVANLAAGVAGLAAAISAGTARGVLGRGRALLPLSGGLVLWAAADVVVGARPTLAAVLSLGGSAAIGWWVLRRAGHRSLAGRVTGAFVTVLLVLAVGLASVSGLVFSADLRTGQAERLETLADGQASELAAAAPRELESTASLLAAGMLTQQLADADGAGALDARAASIAGLPGVDLVVLVDEEGEVVGTSLRGEPLKLADAATIGGDETVTEALGGRSARGLVAFGDGQLVAAGAAPVAPEADGEPQLDRRTGVLLVGRAISTAPVLEGVGSDTGADAAVITDGMVVASTLADEPDEALLAELDGIDDEAGTVELGDEERLFAAAPLTSGADASLGRLVLVPPPDALADVADEPARSPSLAALPGLAVTAALALAVSRRVTRPVQALTSAAERVARGELDTRVRVDRDDEVGRLAAAFDRMTVALGARERELRAATATETGLRARLEAITASMGEALLAVDARGVVTTCNPAAAALLGDEAENLRGCAVGEVLPGAAVGDAGGRLVTTLGAPSSREVVTARGELPGGRLVVATAAPLLGPTREDDDTGPAGRVYVLRDVTEQLRAERLRTEIIANVSHELRTPLTPVRGYLELLRQRDLPSDQVREFAGSASASVATLQRTIDSLIDLADLEAGRTTVELVPTDLDDVVGETLARWRVQLPDRRFTRRLARDLPDVAVDPVLLSRVLDELLDNAVRFSEQTVRVLATTEVAPSSAAGRPDSNGGRINGSGRTRTGDRRVRLVVRDGGPGIPAVRREAVLDDFEQADGSATRDVGGLGLGLSIVQRVLGRLDAGFTLEPAPNGGTDAVLLLPGVEPVPSGSGGDRVPSGSGGDRGAASSGARR